MIKFLKELFKTSKTREREEAIRQEEIERERLVDMNARKMSKRVLRKKFIDFKKNIRSTFSSNNIVDQFQYHYQSGRFLDYAYRESTGENFRRDRHEAWRRNYYHKVYMKCLNIYIKTNHHMESIRDGLIREEMKKIGETAVLTSNTRKDDSGLFIKAGSRVVIENIENGHNTIAKEYFGRGYAYHRTTLMPYFQYTVSADINKKIGLRRTMTKGDFDFLTKEDDA